jgi:predicted AlkP superfamily phosphohydrolase/phosphomutase
MPAKVVVIGFDAMEATLVEQWAGEGKLPTFRELGESATMFRPTNRVDTLPGTTWLEIGTGRLGGTIGWYWNRWQAVAGEAHLRRVGESDADMTAVWKLASDAGHTVAAIDVPQAAPAPGLNGVQLREWGDHEIAFGLGSEPPSFADDVIRRFGPYPGPNGDACEVHETEADFRHLRRGLIDGAETKGRMLRTLLDEGDWDLFFAAFTETHCVSHQFWQFFDESSSWFEPTQSSELRTAIPDVYAALDSSLGHVLAGVDKETFVFVLLSHGMGQSYGGPQLLPEVLVRLGYGSGQGAASNVRSRIPASVKTAIKAIIRGSLRRRLQTAAGSLSQPLESPVTRAMAVPNGRRGAIRLNVKGRDPFGSIEPGAEYDAVCAELAEAIEELEMAGTGEPAVVSVVRTDSVYGEETHPNIPDLIVQFAESRPLTAVRSARVGTVKAPIEEFAGDRSGDHTPHSRLWVRGPGIARGHVVEGGDLLDLAPTVLELLGAPVPEALHGKPLPLAAPAAV